MARQIEDHYARVRRVVERLLQGTAIQDVEDDEIAPVVWDVAESASIFRAESDVLDYVGIGGFPVVRLGEDLEAPISLRSLGFPLPSLWGRPFLYGLDAFLRNISDRYDEGRFLRIADLREAESSFLELATRSIMLRLGVLRSRGRGDVHTTPSDGDFTDMPGGARWMWRSSPPGRASVPTLNFEVSTNTANLRVHWSGAYFIHPNYFSHPTSPATGPLQAGTYVFGVDGGPYGSAVQWDLVAVCSVPNVTRVHLNY
jgi:hypothetical protein